MNIGTIAERARVSRKSIRYYERIGLIPPADRRANGYRTFTENDMHSLSFIKRERSLGFSVEEVRDLLDLWRNKRSSSAAAKAIATQHLEALDRKLAELSSVHRTLIHLVEHCRRGERPDCPILDDLGNPGMSRMPSGGDPHTPLRRARVPEI